MSHRSAGVPAMPKISPLQPITSPETATYIGDLLESLRKIARTQGLNLLAHLLELAVVEAKAVRKDGESVPVQNPVQNNVMALVTKPSSPHCPDDGGSVPPVPAPEEP